MVIEQRPVEVEADRTHSRHRSSLEVDRWPIVYRDTLKLEVAFLGPLAGGRYDD